MRSYDLLDTSVYLALTQNPGRIAQELDPRDKIVVVDEIQRLPVLLNEIHRLIEERGIRQLQRLHFRGTAKLLAVDVRIRG